MTHFKRTLFARRACIAGLAGLMLATAVPTFAFADTEADLASARAKLEEIGRQSDAITGELAELTFELEKTRGEIDAKNSEIAERQEKLSSFVSSEYKGGLAGLLQIVMNAESFDDFVSKVTYMNKVSNAQAATIDDVKVLKEELADKQQEQEKNIKATQKKVDELNKQRESAADLVSSLDAKLQEELAAEAAANEALKQALEESEKDKIDHVENVNPPAPQPQPTPEPEPQPQPDPGPAPQPQPDPEPGYNPGTGNAVVDRAWSWVGKAEYVWGGCAPGQFDCSGFVSYCLTGQYTRLGTTYTFLGWPRVSNPQPGDVAVNSGHCGIYIGNGQMIHAATYGVGVIVGPVQPGMVFVRY
ncbi:MAG: NlpC/P60 family protein [Coriobacteriaceae bacterium]|nr:NlpC/P60 family protein [Coriobacteriaceae bacterium]